MMRKLMLLISAIAALVPFNIFAAPITPDDIDTGIVRNSLESERYIVGINGSGFIYAFGSRINDLFYRVSFDGGITWSTDTDIHTDLTEDVGGMAVWYDRWTPGNTGTRIHIVWSFDNDPGLGGGFSYKYLDVQTNTLSAEIAISTSINADDTTMAVTRAIGGNLYVMTGVSTSSIKFFRSTDNGSSWAARANHALGGANGYITLVPSNNTSQNNDVFACGGITAQPLVCKFYDNTGNTWSADITVGATNLRVGASVSLALDSVGTIWITGSFVNGGNEDIKSFICPVNCTSPTERSNIITGGAFSGVNTLTRVSTYGVGGLNAAVVVTGRTATSGAEVSISSNNGNTWSAPSRFNQSNLSTQIVRQSIPANSQISTNQFGTNVYALWNYSAPNGHYFFNRAISGGIAVPTPTPIAKIWFEKMVDTTTNNDIVWGQMIWMVIASAIVIALMILVKAPPAMYALMLVLVGAGFLSLLYIPPEVAVISVMVVGIIILIGIIANGRANAGGKE